MLSVRPLSLAFVGAASVVLLSAVSPASAAYTFYTDFSAFSAATTGLTTYNFTDGTNPGTLEARPYVVGPLGFSSFDHLTHPYLTNDGLYGSTTSYLDMLGPATSLVVQTQDGSTVYAYGFDLGTPDQADTATVAMDFVPRTILDTFPTSGTPGTTTFFGVTSSDPIGQVSLALHTGSLHFDTVRFYTATVVPEPMTFAAGALALPGLLARRRR